MKRAIYAALVLVLGYASAALAQAKPDPVQYTVLPLRSWLKFEATQNGAMVGGEFKDFSADILFHPENAGASKVKVTVDIASINSATEGVAGELVKESWLAAMAYPQAVFESTDITMVSPNHYIANGNLALKGISKPVTLNFMYEDMGDGSAVVFGSGTLSRGAFEVGSGEWAKSNVVKDEVVVRFRIEAQYQ